MLLCCLDWNFGDVCVCVVVCVLDFGGVCVVCVLI